MANDKFVYVTYIRTTAEKLWEALTSPEFTRQYWCECSIESNWQKGSDWKLVAPIGVADGGQIMEIDRPRRLVISWRNEFMSELKAEGYSRATFELEPAGDSIKLTVTHEMDRAGSKLIQGVSNGWPAILSSLKSLLETGSALEATRKWPENVKRQ